MLRRQSFMALLLLASWIAFAGANHVVLAQNPEAGDDLPLACRNVQYLMQRPLPQEDANPLGYRVAVLPESRAFVLPIGSLAQTWLLDVGNGGNRLRLEFSNADAALEVAVWLGANPLEIAGTIYQTIERGETRQLEYALAGSGVYQVQVRRLDYASLDESAISYSMVGEYPQPAQPSREWLARQEQSLRTHENLPQGVDQPVRFTVQDDYLNGAISRNNNILSFPFRQDDPANSTTVNLAPWAQTFSFVSNDLLLTGMQQGQPNTLYAEGLLATRINLNANNTSLSDRSNVLIVTNWEAVQGVWLLRGCTGVMLRDGRSLLAATDATSRRTIEMRGSLNDFNAGFTASNATGQNQEVSLALDWALINEASQVQMLGGILNIPLACERSLSLATTLLTLTRWQEADPLQTTACVNAPPPIRARLGTGAALQTVDIDWSNLYHFGLLTGADSPQEVQLTFYDRANVREGLQTIRPIQRLRTFSARDEVINMVTDPLPEQSASIHYRLLPAQESYLELIMQGDGLAQTYNPLALPDEAEYVPRALNNTGGECYPTNVLLEELNCTPNGEVNPANGNLWFAVTDHHAQGEQIHLTLTRSYNSRLQAVDGLFGQGWQAGLGFDYATIAYDAQLASRQVNFVTGAVDYPVMLQLGRQPAGLIQFMTPSGSQHLFVEEAAGRYRAQTMPRWQLSEPAPEYPYYVLWQGDNLTYEFDRAGRLRCYGYPDVSLANPDAAAAYPYSGCHQTDAAGQRSGRWVVLDYAWETALNGPGALPDDAPQVVISDAASLRQLELYFDEQHHVTRSILRDSTSAATEGCSLAENCYEVLYRYSDSGELEEVRYPDGQEAIYGYVGGDASHLLCYQNDPRAPQLPAAIYTYDETDASVNGVYASEVQQTRPTCDPNPDWRVLDLQRSETRDGIRTTITNAYNQPRVMAYEVEGISSIQDVGNDFILVSQSSTTPGAFNLNYDWSDGFMRTVNTPIVDTFAIWNSTNLSYEQGELTGVGLGSVLTNSAIPGFGIVDAIVQPDDTRRRAIIFGDLSRIEYDRDALGRLQRLVNEDGAAFTYEWADGQIERVQTELFSGRDLATIAIEATHYERNAAGLVIASERSVDNNLPYRIDYTRDGLGRITALRDSVNRRYTLAYDHETVPCERSNADCQAMVLTITDTTGTITTLRFNLRGQLVEQHIATNAELLRCTTYTYNDAATTNLLRFYGVLIGVDHWNDPTNTRPGNCATLSNPRSTTYAYDALTDGGYRLTVTDPFRRDRVYVYDWLDRLVEQGDFFGNRSLYQYNVETAAAQISESAQARELLLNIEAQHYRGNVLDRCVITYFDQTRSPVVVDILPGNGEPIAASEVASNAGREADPCEANTVTDGLRWIFNYQQTDSPDSPSIKVEYLNTVRDVVRGREVGWENPTTPEQADVRFGQDSGIASNARPNLRPEDRRILYSRSETRNSRGFVDTVTSGTGELVSDTWLECMRENGQRQVIQYKPDQQPERPCRIERITDSGIAAETWYNVYGQMICHADLQHGLILRTYTPDAANQQWVVTDAAYTNGLTCAEALNPTADTSDIRPQGTRIMAYNALGDLLSLTEVDGTQYAYDVDDYGQITAITIDQAPEPTTRYTYNPLGLLTEVIHDDDSGFSYQYNDLGLLTLQRNRDTNNTISYIYDSTGRLTDRIAPRGERTTYQRLIRVEEGRRLDELRVTDTTGGVYRYLVDPVALTVRVIDPLNNETAYAFDTLGMLWRIEDASGREHFLDYDDQGRVIRWRQDFQSSGAARDLRWGYAYDAALAEERITLTEASLPNWQQVRYRTPDGQVGALGTGNQALVDATYDAFGRLSNLNADGIDWRIDYAENERTLLLETVTDGQASPLATLTYNAAGQLLAYAANDEDITTWTYDGNRVQIQQGEQLRQELQVESGSGVQPPRLIIATGDENPAQTITYSFDPNGQVSTVTSRTCLENAEDSGVICDADPNSSDIGTTIWSNNIELSYNDLGLPIGIVNANQSVISYSYDRMGNVETYQTATRDTYRYEYDELNRLSRVIGPDGISAILQYNRLDEVVGICRTQQGANVPQTFAACVEQTNGTVLESYRTDALGRISYRLRETPTSTEATGYFYALDGDDNGRMRGWGVVNALDAGSPLQPVSAVGFNALVGIAYTPDLLRTASITTDAQQHSFSYDVLGRLISSSGYLNYEYRYDATGQLSTTVIREEGEESGNPQSSIRIDPLAAADGHSGYRLSFDNPEQALAFLLNESGLLASIRLDTPEATENALLDLSYRLGDSAVVATDAQNNLYLTNGLAQPTGTFYRGAAFSQTAARDASGGVERESMTVARDFFSTDDPLDYLITQNRDETNRSSTIRVIDANGDVIYTSISSYELGTLRSQIRQFADGTQQTITHVYARNNNGQIGAQRTITDVAILDPDAGGEPLLRGSVVGGVLLLIAGLWGMWRRRVLVFVASAIVIVSMGMLVSAQGSATLRYEYSYDERGNMSAVRELADGQELVCTTRYTYDSANRLIEQSLTPANEVAPSAIRRYEYDAFQRVVRVGEMRLQYVGDARQPISVEQDAERLLLVQTENRAVGFVVAPDNATQQMLYDNNGQVTTLATDNRATPLQLFDPRLRPIPLPDSLTGGLPASEPCTFATPDDALARLIFLKDAIWDVAGNLIFVDGRAYNPTLERFLQADPLGPDLSGDVYNYPARLGTPPVRPWQIPYLTGLQQLEAALLESSISEQLTAQQVQATNESRIRGQLESAYLQSLYESADRVDRALNDLLDFNDILAQEIAFNVVRVDERTGAVQFPDFRRPAHRGWAQAAPQEDARRVFPVDVAPEIVPPLADVTGLLEQSYVNRTPFTTYVADGWRPAHPAFPASRTAWVVHLPRLDDTPDRLEGLLFSPLLADHNGFTMTAFMQQQLTSLTLTGGEWMAAQLDAILPTTPAVPPATITGLQAIWFSEDTFGIADDLAQAWPVPDAPAAPRVRLGIDPAFNTLRTVPLTD